jgi:MFS family permease
VLVLFAQDLMGLDDLGYGILLTATAVGGIAGSLAAGVVIRLLGRSRAVLASVVGLAATMAVPVGTAEFWPVAAALAAFALASSVWDVAAVSYRQAAVPEALMGRVMGTYRFIACGTFPLGAGIGGLVSRQLGLRAPFVLGAVLIGVLLLYLYPVIAGADLAPRGSSSS